MTDPSTDAAAKDGSAIDSGSEHDASIGIDQKAPDASIGDATPNAADAANLDAAEDDATTIDAATIDAATIDAATDASAFDGGDGGSVDAGPSVPAPTCFTTFGGVDADAPAGVVTNPVTHTLAVYGSYVGAPDYGKGVLPAATVQNPRGYIAFFDEACTLKSVAPLPIAVGRMVVGPDGSFWALPADTISVIQQGPRELYVDKFSGAGAPLTRRLVASAEASSFVGVRPFDILVDTQGNLLVLGRYSGRVSFPAPGGATLNGNQLGSSRESQFFLVKYSPTFAYVWLRSYSAYPSTDQPNAPFSGQLVQLILGANDDFLLRGRLSGGGMGLSADIPPVSYQDGRAFIARGSGTNGPTMWGYSTLNGSYHVLSGVGNGVALFAGKLATDTDLGQGTLSKNSPFIAGINETTGRVDWSYSASATLFPALSTNARISATPHPDGSYVLSGVTSTKEAYVTRVSSTSVGTPILIQTNAGNALLLPASTVTASGQTVVTGAFNGTLNHGAYAGTSAGSTDIYLMMFP